MKGNGYNVHDGVVETLSSESEVKLRGDISAVSNGMEGWRANPMPFHEYLQLLARRKQSAINPN